MYEINYRMFTILYLFVADWLANLVRVITHFSFDHSIKLHFFFRKLPYFRLLKSLRACIYRSFCFVEIKIHFSLNI